MFLAEQSESYLFLRWVTVILRLGAFRVWVDLCGLTLWLSLIFAGSGQHAPVFLVERGHFQGAVGDADFVFDQQLDKLLAIDESDVSLTWRVGFFARGFGEVAGGDDDAVLMNLERAAQLGNDGSPDVALPFLGLHGSTYLGQAGGVIDTGHVNPAIRTVRGHLHRVLIETHLDQQVADERLEAFRGNGLQELHQLGARALVNLLHMRVDPLGLPLCQTEAAVPGTYEVGASCLVSV